MSTTKVQAQPHVSALQDALCHECDVITHLASKLPAGSDDYRPSPGQRSTLELLRYLAACGIGGARAMHDRDWAGYKECAARVEKMPAKEFPAAMARQKQELVALLGGLSDKDLVTRKSMLPWDQEVTLGRALQETTLKWLTAYKMQLFLYAKALGVTALATSNCWGGMDPKPKP